MNKFIILLLSIFMIGMSGAVTLTETPNAKFGPPLGFWNQGTIQAGDLYATDDLLVGDDAQFLGAVDVAGSVNFDNLYVDGTFAVNETSALNATNVTTLNVGGAATLESTASIAGLATVANLKSNATGYFVTTLNNGGTATLNAVVSNGTIGGTDITGSGTIKGEQITSTDDMQAYGSILGQDIKANATIYAGTTINSGGKATLNSVEVNITGTYTGIQTFTAAPVFNAGVSIPTGDTIDTVDADAVRAAGVILPGEMVITIPLTKTDISAGEINCSSSFIADDAWTITSIEESHTVAESTATTLTVGVQKMTGTQTLVQGINLTESNFSLKGAADTVQAGTLSTDAGVTSLADGTRIGIICNMTGVSDAAEFRAGAITLHMKRA